VLLAFPTEQAVTILEDVPLLTGQKVWLEQDGTLPHFGRQVTAFLNQHFPDHWIG
jgi:hypothetical protein